MGTLEDLPDLTAPMVPVIKGQGDVQQHQMWVVAGKLRQHIPENPRRIWPGDPTFPPAPGWPWGNPSVVLHNKDPVHKVFLLSVFQNIRHRKPVIQQRIKPEVNQMPEMNRSFPPVLWDLRVAAAATKQERMRQYFASLPPLYPGRHPSKRGKPAHRGRAAPVCRKPHGLFRSLRKGLIHKERRQVPGRNGLCLPALFCFRILSKKSKLRALLHRQNPRLPGLRPSIPQMRTRLCSFILLHLPMEQLLDLFAVFDILQFQRGGRLIGRIHNNAPHPEDSLAPKTALS